jgi:hypothetical protein
VRFGRTTSLISADKSKDLERRRRKGLAENAESPFGELTGKLVDHSSNSVTHVSNVEVEQQANWSTAKPQVREELGLKNRSQLGDGFYLDDDDVLNVHAIAHVNGNSLIGDGQTQFDLVLETPQLQFAAKAHPIGTL